MEVASSGQYTYLLTTVVTQNQSSLSFRRSLDGGYTFGNPANIANLTIVENPRIFASGNNAYVTWTGFDGGKPVLLLRQSTDDGETFGNTVPISSNSTAGAVLGVQTSANALKIVWVGQIENSKVSQIFSSKSIDGGRSFESPVSLSDPHANSMVQGIAYSGNSLYVLWATIESCQSIFIQDCTKDYFLRQVSGESDGSIIPLDKLSGSDFVSATASGNTIYVEGLRHNYLNGTFENTSILLLRSYDGGGTFTSTTKNYTVNIDDASIAVAGSSLYQFWTVSSKAGLQTLYYAKSVEGGNSFGNPVNLSGDSDLEFVNMQMGMTTYDNNVYLAWQGIDSTDSNHVYLGVFGPASVKTSIVNNIHPAIGLQPVVSGSAAYLTFGYMDNLFLERVDSSGPAFTRDFDCSTNSNPKAGDIAITSPIVQMDTNPDRLIHFEAYHSRISQPQVQMKQENVTSILAGWKTAIRYTANNTAGEDIGVVYNINVFKDGLVSWHASQNGLLVCNKSEIRTFYWSPRSQGDYTIQASVYGQNGQVLAVSNQTFVAAKPNPDLQDYTDKNLIDFTTNSTLLHLNQGGSVTFPVVIRSTSPNYAIGNTMLLLDAPQDMQAWFSRGQIPISTTPQTLNVTVYAGSGVSPGLYKLKILGQGNAIDLVKGEPITIGDPYGGFSAAVGHYDTYAKYLSSHGGGLNDTLDVTVLPSGNQVPYVSIGPVHSYQSTICQPQEIMTYMKSCSTSTEYQDISLKIYSSTSQNVTLHAVNYPDGTYLRFIPDTVYATPSGTDARMLLAGSGRLFIPNPISGKVVSIEAISNNGTGVTYLPMERGVQIQLINSTGPIDLIPTHHFNNGTSVYAIEWTYNPPEGQNPTLPIKLTVLGIFGNDSKVQPLPDWLAVNITQPSFVLNATQPHHFEMEITSPFPPARNVTLAISEDEGGKVFVGRAPVIIQSPIISNPSLEHQLALARERIMHAVPAGTAHSGWTSTVRR